MFDYFDGVLGEHEVFTSLKINPFEVKREILFIRDLKAREERNEDDRKILDKKFKIKHTVEYIQLDKIMPLIDDFVKFNEYSEEDSENLKTSIKNYGLLSPIILWKMPTGIHYILSGFERYRCYCSLYLEESEEKNEEIKNLYGNIPSYVIGYEDIDDIRARDIMIDANLCTRKMDPISYSNAIANKVACKFAEEDKREELAPSNRVNIMDEVAKDMNKSKPTIYGYKKLQNLTRTAGYLLQKKQISLKSARKLADYPHEIQLAFITHIGIENVNDLKISVFNPNKKPTQSELKTFLKIAKEYEVPVFSTIKIKCATKHGKVVKEKIGEVLRKLPKEFLVKARFPKFIT